MAENCVGFSVQAAYPQYYPSNDGKRAAHYGNPPLCFGLPGQEGPPSGTRRSHLHPRRLLSAGEQIEAIEELIPAASSSPWVTPQSQLYSAELLSAKAATAPARSPRNGLQRAMGSLILVLDLDLFAPAPQVRHGVDELVRLAGEQMIPLRGYDEVTLPGTPEHRNKEAYARDGRTHRRRRRRAPSRMWPGLWHRAPVAGLTPRRFLP